MTKKKQERSDPPPSQSHQLDVFGPSVQSFRQTPRNAIDHRDDLSPTDRDGTPWHEHTDE